jgi:hypothetical protein
MSNQINPVEAKGFAMVIKKQLDTNIDLFSGGGGGSLKSVPGLFSDISLGGLTTQNEYPSLFESQESGVLTKGRRTSIVDVSGDTDIVSSYWNDVKPSINSYEKGVLINTGLKPADISKTGLTLGILFNTGLKTNTILMSVNGLKSENKTDVLNKTDLKNISLLKLDTLLKTDTLNKTDTKQQLELKTITITDAISFIDVPSIFSPPVPPSPPVTPIRFDFSDDFMQPKVGGTGAFQVMVRPRQYVDGKRVNAGKPYPLSSKAYAEDDAKAVGHHKVGNTAKATFFLKPVDKQPSKRPRGVESWYNVISQYDKKDDGRFVELSRFRINSPGEIREISMRGWSSRKHIKSRRRQ